MSWLGTTRYFGNIFAQNYKQLTKIAYAYQVHLIFNLQLETAKKAYHMTCKEEKIASTREANSKGEASVTSDQQKKLQEKLDKCKNDVQKVRQGNNAYYVQHAFLITIA